MFQNVKIVNEDDHLYYNVLLTNNTGSLLPATFIDRRTIPIIDKADDYHITVIRFTIPSFNIPIFIWPDNPSSTTYFAVRLTDGVSTQTAYVQCPSVLTIPQFPSGVYNYQDFIYAINVAIAAAFNAGVWVPGFNQPPYLGLDSTTGHISFYAPSYFNYTATNPFRLLLNLNLIRFLDDFPYLASTASLGPFSTTFSAFNFYTLVGNTQNVANPFIIGAPTEAGMVVTQNYSSLISWNSLKSIVFSSGTLPLKEEYIQNLQNNATNTNLQVLTDFEPTLSELGAGRSLLQYNATVYRYIDLISNNSIKTIDLTIYWTDTSGNLYPLYISPQQYISAKILFSRKTSLK